MQMQAVRWRAGSGLAAGRGSSLAWLAAASGIQACRWEHRAAIQTLSQGAGRQAFAAAKPQHMPAALHVLQTDCAPPAGLPTCWLTPSCPLLLMGAL